MALIVPQKGEWYHYWSSQNPLNCQVKHFTMGWLLESMGYNAEIYIETFIVRGCRGHAMWRCLEYIGQSITYIAFFNDTTMKRHRYNKKSTPPPFFSGCCTFDRHQFFRRCKILHNSVYHSSGRYPPPHPHQKSTKITSLYLIKWCIIYIFDHKPYSFCRCNIYIWVWDQDSYS